MPNELFKYVFLWYIRWTKAKDLLLLQLYYEAFLFVKKAIFVCTCMFKVEHIIGGSPCTVEKFVSNSNANCV